METCYKRQESANPRWDSDSFLFFFATVKFLMLLESIGCDLYAWYDVVLIHALESLGVHLKVKMSCSTDESCQLMNCKGNRWWDSLGAQDPGCQAQ